MAVLGIFDLMVGIWMAYNGHWIDAILMIIVSAVVIWIS